MIIVNKKCFFSFVLLLTVFSSTAQERRFDPIDFSKFNFDIVTYEYVVKKHFLAGTTREIYTLIYFEYTEKFDIEMNRDEYKAFYRNGQLRDSLFYGTYGYPIGIRKKYYRTGNLKYELTYDSFNFEDLNSHKSREVMKAFYEIKYHKNGQKMHEVKRTFGRKTGQMIFYNKEGDRERTKQYELQ